MKHASILLHNNLQDLERLAAFMDGVSEALGMDPRTRFHMNLACDELVTNTILYGFAQGEPAEHFIQIDVELHEEGWELRMTDSGLPFNPLLRESPDVELGIEQRGIGGLGIHFVRQTMDGVRYERLAGRNVLTMTKLRQMPK